LQPIAGELQGLASKDRGIGLLQDHPPFAERPRRQLNEARLKTARQVAAPFVARRIVWPIGIDSGAESLVSGRPSPNFATLNPARRRRR